MGFGHRVYKTYDPRASIMKTTADKLLAKVKGDDPLLEIAQRLEDVALSDKYFIDRNLFPNVDFYSGVILRAMGIPVNMFTVIFAMGRMPGWIANWKETHDSGSVLYRPRQVYVGQGERSYVPIGERGSSDCLAPRTSRNGRPSR
jgi:citrate synthase